MRGIAESHDLKASEFFWDGFVCEIAAYLIRSYPSRLLPNGSTLRVSAPRDNDTSILRTTIHSTRQPRFRSLDCDPIFMRLQVCRAYTWSVEYIQHT